MADTARGAVNMTPVITITADADTDAVDAIHHDFKSALGGKLEVDTSSGFTAVKWWGGEYLVGSNANLIGGHTNGTFYGSDAVVGDFTDGTAFAAGDEVKMVCIMNLGYSDTSKSTASTAKVWLTLDGGNPSTQLDVLEVGAGESIVLKFKTGAAAVDIDNLHAHSSSGNILVKVCALIDDGA
jgi:hypothetical protein